MSIEPEFFWHYYNDLPHMSASKLKHIVSFNLKIELFFAWKRLNYIPYPSREFSHPWEESFVISSSFEHVFKTSFPRLFQFSNNFFLKLPLEKKKYGVDLKNNFLLLKKKKKKKKNFFKFI